MNFLLVGNSRLHWAEYVESDYKFFDTNKNDDLPENINTNKIYNNKRKSSIKYEINYLQSIAKKNRIYGWIPTYRKNLRKKHKEDILNAPLIYIFLTYIRSLIRFLISKTNLIL